MQGLWVVDRRLLAALVLALVPFVVHLDSTTTTETSCSYTDVAGIVGGGAGLVLVAISIPAVRTQGRPGYLTAALVTVLGVIQVLRGFGVIAGPCHGDTALVIGLIAAGLLGAMWLVELARYRPPPLVDDADLPAELAAAPDLALGLKRCRACRFSSNPLDAAVCRNCGSSDLDVVQPGRVG